MSDDIKKLSDKIAELERQIVVLKQVAFEGPKTNLDEVKKLKCENIRLKSAIIDTIKIICTCPVDIITDTIWHDEYFTLVDFLAIRSGIDEDALQELLKD